MKYYRFSATLDRRTSATCWNHDGHVYPINEYQPGITAPPLHPNCRSTIAGSLYGPDKKTETRIARNDKGKTYYVPADMTYRKWFDKYVPREVAENFRRKIAADGHEIIDQPTYNKLTKNFLRNGGVIIRGEETEKHLQKVGAYTTKQNLAYYENLLQKKQRGE